MALIQSYVPIQARPFMADFESEQVYYILKRVLQSGRKLIGFDLMEIGVGENDWDANVGAHVLWKLCNLLVASNN